jgi:reactive intermediate/imine deaminase
MTSGLLFVPLTTAPAAGADAAAQARAALSQIDAALRASGSSLASVVATTVYLRHASEFAAMNAAYREAWSAALPTRTTVVAAPPDAAALVGISAVAVRDGAMREPLHPAGWLPSANPYSYAMRAGDTVFLSGLLARGGRDQQVKGTTIAEQTRAVLENAREVLAAAGLTLRDVVSARVFLPDMADFAAMNDVYGEYFTDAPPARATVGAALTAPPYRVEMTFVARRGGRDVVDDERLRFKNLSAAIRSKDLLFVAGALGVTDATRHDAGLQARETLARIERVVSAAGFRRDEVRDLLAYITDPRDADAVLRECRAFAPGAAVSVPVISLAVPDGKVEIVTTAERA